MYYSGGTHPDLFAHRDPVQLEDGRWYFHRTRGECRGGSFKGLDIALGDGTAYFGILIRAVAKPDGTLLDGPCVTVDHLLARTNTAKRGRARRRHQPAAKSGTRHLLFTWPNRRSRERRRCSRVRVWGCR